MADFSDPSSIFRDKERFRKMLTELRSFAAPPQGIKDTMAAVSILFGKDPTWGNAKKLMADSNFFDMLKEYDKDNIKPEDMAKIRDNYIIKPDFNPDSVRRISEAGELLCEWVLAIEKYDIETKGQGGQTA